MSALYGRTSQLAPPLMRLSSEKPTVAASMSLYGTWVGSVSEQQICALVRRRTALHTHLAHAPFLARLPLAHALPLRHNIDRRARHLVILGIFLDLC